DRIYGERAEPSQEDALEIERLAGALEAFDAKDEDDMSEADWDEVDRLEETLASLRAGTRLYTAEQKAIAGCVIYPGRAGVEIHEGLVRRQDRKKAARLSQGENGGKGRDGAPSPAYGKALRADLGVYKAQALQAALAGEPALAALALQFACIWQALAPHDAESLGGVRLAAMPAYLRVTKGELGETGAARRLGAIEASLRTDIFAQGGWRGAWEKFRELSGEDQAALAAFAFARLIEPAAADEGFADVLGRSLGWRIRDYWTPTAENFFSRIRKDQLVRFLTETMGEASAACLTRDFKAKKKDIAALCERLVEGRAPASPDERAAIDAWTPEEMRLCEKEPGQSANDCAAANDGKASMTQAE
ncbi:MAG: hypothetical protein KAH44_30100, partial [Oricola sp.]|nr:hypothetical protein [Oricola sp.]